MQAARPVFINEIHYDNADTDLSGWSVVFYNGNGGLVYATQHLVNTLLDTGNGMGMIAVYQPGIQNGRARMGLL